MDTIELLLFINCYPMVGGSATFRLETVNQHFERFQRYYDLARFGGELDEALPHEHFGEAITDGEPRISCPLSNSQSPGKLMEADSCSDGELNVNLYIACIVRRLRPTEAAAMTPGANLPATMDGWRRLFSEVRMTGVVLSGTFLKPTHFA
jgi:hypothetical protein